MLDPKTLRRWMTFKLTPRPNGTVEKQPLSVLGGFASSNDPATWSSYETARKYCVEHSDCSLGFVLGKEVGLAVVDIDKARASKEQPWPAWVEREVEELDSFTEESVSGLGLHVWVWGSVPANRNNQKCHVEVHDSAKMFCVSQAFAERWEEIKPRDLSLLYRRIDAGEVGPSYHKPIVAYAWNETKFRELMAGRYEAYFSSKSEAVASALCTLATKHAGDSDKMRAEFEASELCALWNGKWERLGEREIERAVKWYEEKQEKKPIAELPAFRHPGANRPRREYVLRPRDRFDGWFPTSSVSVIGGPSGAGKTSVLLAMLHAQARGDAYLGHDGGRLPFAILYADRQGPDNEETLDRMGLLDAGLNIECVPLCWDTEVVLWVLNFIEAQKEIPGVVVIEGADMLPSDASDLRTVAVMIRRFQEIATHYGIAFVMSVGAPKSTKDGKHALLRDRIFGSQIWGRMASTIATMSIPDDGDGTGSYRALDVQHRNAPSEHYDLEFLNGRLVVRTAEAEDVDELGQWARGQEWFNVADAEGAQEQNRWLIGKPKVKSRIAELVKAKKLEIKNSLHGPRQYRWRRSA